MPHESCSSSISTLPASPAAAQGDATISTGGWRHTVAQDLRRKHCERLDSGDSSASSASSCFPLKAHPQHGAQQPVVQKRLWSKADFAWMRVIGAGSFGRVSLARHTASGRIVAIKAMSKTALMREQQTQHVNDERAMLAKVAGYPFLINMLATFQDVDNVYLVMDYVPGGEFFTHLRDHGRLREEHARFYVAQIVLALEHLHSKGIAYRDLKPENLLIGSDGYVQLTDLGFAKVIKGRTYTMCGTPDYLAPEVIQGNGHGTAVDWWSLGCVAYEFIHGFPPFYTGQPDSTYKRVLRLDYQFPAHFSTYAQDLISKLLNPDPSKRLGGTPAGIQAIKDHTWFVNLDWTHLANKVYAPPHLPPIKAPDDTSCFDKFDHLPPMESSAGLTPQQQALFASFSQ